MSARGIMGAREARCGCFRRVVGAGWALFGLHGALGALSGHYCRTVGHLGRCLSVRGALGHCFGAIWAI